MTISTHAHLHWDATFVDPVVGRPCEPAVFDDQAVTPAEFDQYHSFAPTDLKRVSADLRDTNPVISERLRTIAAALEVAHFENLAAAGTDFLWTEGVAGTTDRTRTVTLLIAATDPGGGRTSGRISTGFPLRRKQDA